MGGKVCLRCKGKTCREQTLVLHQLKTKEDCNVLAITNEQTLLLYQLHTKRICNRAMTK